MGSLYFGGYEGYNGKANPLAPFGKLSVMEPETVNLKLHFTEATFTENDKSWFLWAVFSHTNENVRGPNNITLKAGDLICLEIHKGDWGKSNWKDGKKETTQIKQAKWEKFYCDYLTANSEQLTDKYFMGFLSIEESEKLFAMHEQGKIDMHSEDFEYYRLVPVEANILADKKIPEVAANGKGGWSGSKAQSEADKLADRLNFIEQALAPESKFKAVGTQLGLTEKDVNALLVEMLGKVIS